MTQITLTVDDSRARDKISHVTLAVQTLPDKIIRPEMQIATEETRASPPELPGQRYVRTGRRYAATHLEHGARAHSYRIISNPRYRGGGTGNPYTIGDSRGRGQAAVHQGRWSTMFDAVGRAMTRIKERAAEHFRSMLGKGPGGP